jgi:hypothetical protein
MSKFPIVPADRRAVRQADDDNAVELLPPARRATPFFSFSYSYTEWSTSGGRTQVRSRKTSFEDGKVVNESFEGELPAGAYEQQVRDAQEQLLGQMRLFLQPFSWFLPSWRKPDR